jgi:hypothetical protein
MLNDSRKVKILLIVAVIVLAALSWTGKSAIKSRQRSLSEPYRVQYETSQLA